MHRMVLLLGAIIIDIMARPRGIEPRSQAPEAYVISIGPRAQSDSEDKYM